MNNKYAKRRAMRGNYFFKTSNVLLGLYNVNNLELSHTQKYISKKRIENPGKNKIAIYKSSYIYNCLYNFK